MPNTLSVALLASLAALAAASCAAAAPTSGTVTFRSADGIAVTADVYAPNPKEAPFIVLCHQAGWSRGEYKELAPWLASLGYNCMAIDQRSGGKINGVDNQTLIEALKAGKDTGYPAAEQDIVAAVEYARKKIAKGKIVLWGSSYSSSLALVVAAKNPGIVDAVVSASPGEYFGEYGLSKNWVREHAGRLAIPALVMGAANERQQEEMIFDAIADSRKELFVPPSGGRHGSSALWQRNAGHEAYREAVAAFLSRYAR